MIFIIIYIGELFFLLYIDTSVTITIVNIIGITSSMGFISIMFTPIII